MSDTRTVVVTVSDCEIARAQVPFHDTTIVVQVDPLVLSREIEERVTEAVMERLRQRWRGVSF